MYAVVVFFEVKTECIERFRELILANAKTSLAVEDGCHQFDVCLSEEKPNQVFLYELYDDKAAFDLHLASGHFTEFAAATEQMVTDKKLHLYAQVAQF